MIYSGAHHRTVAPACTQKHSTWEYRSLIRGQAAFRFTLGSEKPPTSSLRQMTASRVCKSTSAPSHVKACAPSVPKNPKMITTNVLQNRCSFTHTSPAKWRRMFEYRPAHHSNTTLTLQLECKKSFFFLDRGKIWNSRRPLLYDTQEMALAMLVE